MIIISWLETDSATGTCCVATFQEAFTICYALDKASNVAYFDCNEELEFKFSKYRPKQDWYGKVSG